MFVKIFCNSLWFFLSELFPIICALFKLLKLQKKARKLAVLLYPWRVHERCRRKIKVSKPWRFRKFFLKFRISGIFECLKCWLNCCLFYQHVLYLHISECHAFHCFNVLWKIYGYICLMAFWLNYFLKLWGQDFLLCANIPLPGDPGNEWILYVLLLSHVSNFKV